MTSNCHSAQLCREADVEQNEKADDNEDAEMDVVLTTLGSLLVYMSYVEGVG